MSPLLTFVSSYPALEQYGYLREFSYLLHDLLLYALGSDPISNTQRQIPHLNDTIGIQNSNLTQYR